VTSVSGLILIDKPVGPTSHDIVAGIRRKLGVKRVGHAGTLDPGASGLLVVCVGTATRLLEYMTADEKTYVGKIVFGISTDTDDAYGEAKDVVPVSGLTQEKLNLATRAFTGKVSQIVPKYSAVHIEGKRAYELARAGKDFEAPIREVSIREIELNHLQYQNQTARADFRITCSKGTYIRALCRDIGSFLQLPAHMGSLRRTKSGTLSIKDAVDFTVFLESTDPFAYLTNPLHGLAHMPVLPLSSMQIQLLANGQAIVRSESTDIGTYVVLVQEKVAMVVDCIEREGERQIKPHKVLLERR
jgi:tRNA pseudouridine55 synthase